MKSLPKTTAVHKRRTRYAALVGAFLLVSAAIYASTAEITLRALPPQQANSRHENLPGTIDGSIDPNLIPDSKAYSLLFRFLSKRAEEQDKRLLQTFIANTGVRPEDTEKLIAAAEEFSKSVSVLDRQASEIKRQSGPNLGPESMAQLILLEKQKHDFVARLVDSLPKRLSETSMQSLRGYMKEQFKRHMKIVSAQ